MLNVGAWNVRTLLDSTIAKRPDRRTALVARELERYNVDIAALSETRFADKGSLTESCSGYTFFWSGRSTEERRDAGVGFAIKSQLARKLTKLPEGLNDRLMTLQIPLTGKKQATLISAYAPTMTNPDDVKDKFYEELDTLISAVPASDKLIVLGDFNARVGNDHHTWEGTIGRHGIGKCNSNGLQLLKTCASHDLVITNTLFRLPTRKKTSWMHPRSKHWHLIDYVITRGKDRADVRITRAMCGADCWTDHRLIMSKFRLHIQPPRRPQKAASAKRLNVAKLKNSKIVEHFSAELQTKLSDTHLDAEASIDMQWTAFRDAVYPVALEHLGPAPSVIKTGMPTTLKLLTKYSLRNTWPSEPTKTIPSPSRNMTHTRLRETVHRNSFAICKTSGSTRNLKRSKCMQTSTTPNVFMTQLRPSMAPSQVVHHPSSAPMGRNC